MLMINRRITGEHINFGPWTLGKWGLPINIFAAVYTLITAVFNFFPARIDLPVTPSNMNYSSLVYGGVVVLGLLYYAVVGHHYYVDPTLDLQLDDP